MKKNKLVTLATLAFACLAAPFAASAATDGDIVEIRAVDTDDMCFGGPTGRNASSANLCTSANALSAGDKLYIRVRMLVRNYEAVMSDHTGTVEPQDWDFAFIGAGSQYLYKPALGLYVGSRAVYATYSDYGPNSWQKSGRLNYTEDGQPDSSWKYYTDFYFCYTVEAGDIGLPVRLMANTGKPASSTDSSTAYCLLNVNDGGSTRYALQDTVKNQANFYYGPSARTGTEPEWPTGGTDGALRNYDLTAEGVFVKTIDFDTYNAEGDTWKEGDIWRNVYPGSSENPGMSPSLIVPGGSQVTNVTVWVWTTNNVAYPVGSGAVSMGTTNMVPIKISSGDTSVSFAIQGGTAAKAGQTVDIFLSPSKSDVYTPAGNLVNTTVSRKLQIISAPPPYVRVMIDGEPESTLTPKMSDFNVAAATLQIRLSQAYSKDVEVMIHPSLTAAPTKDWKSYVSLSQYSTGGLAAFTTNVTFTATEMSEGTLTKTLQIYTLGSDDDTVAAPKGILFVADVTAKNGARSYYSDNASNVDATLYLKSTNPIITNPTYDQTFTGIQGAAVYTFGLEIEDTYKNLTDTEGYTITFNSGEVGSTNEVIECTTSANRKWHFGTDGTLQENGGAFPVKYSGAGGDFTSLIQVTGPDGHKSTYTGVVKTAPVEVKVSVDPAATIEATVSKKTWNESGTPVAVNFTLSKKASQTMYAFLVPSASTAEWVRGDGVVLDGAATGGAEIHVGDTTSTGTIYLYLLDGIREALGGTTVQFDLVLCSTPDYDPARIVDGYSSKSLVMKVYNVEPSIKEISRAAGGKIKWSTWQSQPKEFPIKIAKGVSQTFTITSLTEPGEIDKEVMHMRWEVEEYDETGAYVTGTTKTFVGKASANPFTYSFVSAGTANISVTIWDKDMDEDDLQETSTYTFTVNVSGQPTISVREAGERFSELDYTGSISVQMSATAVDTIKVRAVVTPYESSTDPGRFILDPSRLEAGTSSTYLLTFKPGTTTALLDTLTFSDLDGTIGSQTKGFRIELSIADDLMDVKKNPDGTPYKEFFLCEEGRVFVDNQAPDVTAPKTNKPEGTTDTDYEYEVQLGKDEGHSIQFTVSGDCEADTEALFYATFTCTGGYGYLDDVEVKSGEAVLVTGNESHTFVPVFTSQGSQTISLRIQDKDMKAGAGPTLEETTWYYSVQPSKVLYLVANGPSYTTTASLCTRYASAKGHGVGHVYSTIADGEEKNFRVTYNCGLAASADIYAFGYKVGAVDNGTLDSGYDLAINSKGNSTGVTDFYTYTGDYDNFLYGWVSITTEEGTQTATLASVSPEAADKGIGVGSAILPTELQESSSSSSTSSSKSSGTYADTTYEAIFSKEYLKTDNLGDINQDGIPDRMFLNYGFDAFDTTAGTLSGDDLVNVSKYNTDGDYLPATPSATLKGVQMTSVSSTDGTSTSSNSTSSVTTVGVPFTAIYEIRGIGEGLNLAGVSDMDLTPSEMYAFKRYLKQNGITAETEEQLAAEFKKGNWTPEAPTDPTLADTDGDSLDDGYEYYYWYSAKVYGATGERYEIHAQGKAMTPTVISADTIAKSFDPNSAFSQEDRDTDNDGLTDVEEAALGTNACHWDTDADGIPDGWEVKMGTDPLDGDPDNADGDYMAYQEVENQLVVEIDTGDPLTSFWSIDNLDTKGNKKYDIVKAADSELVQGFLLIDKSANQPVYVFEGSATDLAKYADDDQVLVDMPVREVYSTKETDSNGVESVCFWVGTSKTLNPGFVLVDADEGTEKYVWADNSEADDACKVRVAKLGPAIIEKNGEMVENDFAVADITNMVAVYRYGTMSDKLFAIEMHCELDKTTNAVYEIKGTCVETNIVETLTNGVLVSIRPDAKVAYMHDQVFAHNGFDPRTGWGNCGHGYCGKRWCASCGGTEAAGNSGLAVNTKAFNAADEYALIQYRYVNGLREFADDAAKEMEDVWDEATTMPTAETTAAIAADTDLDGAPDGWELYVLKNPNAGLSDTTDQKDDEWDVLSAAVDRINIELTDETGDGLTHPAEFMGTDTIAMYADCPTIGGSDSASGWNWMNKFFPTNPYSSDTDGDGIKDIDEKTSSFSTMDYSAGQLSGKEVTTTFLYASTNDTSSICILGGGLNPCSVDTDGDHLPDLWEKQFAGVAADGAVTGGMDGTNPNDATEDFDHDGLYNAEEYLTQTLRHLRYDVMFIGTTAKDGSKAADAAVLEGMMDGTVLASSKANYIYGPDESKYAKTADDVTRRGFFGTSPHAWDPNDLRSANADKLNRIMLTPGTTYTLCLTNAFKDAAIMRLKGYIPADLYATTDPRMQDTDGDGMDDFYEIYHGLNPMLSETRDVIAEAYANYSFLKANMPLNHNRNEFTDPHGTDESGDLVAQELPKDFVKFPWLAGMGLADPDGDGLRNDQETILVNGSDPQKTNTDPSPMWMTDNSFKYSYTAQYYKGTSALSDYWTLGSSGLVNGSWMFAYEMNEGYDTDNDGLSDGEELTKAVVNATDPQLFTDPARRQALYFPGVVDGVPSLAITYEPSGVSNGAAVDMFHQFTAECWIRPESASLVKNSKCSVLERVCSYPQSNKNSSDATVQYDVVVDPDGNLVTNIAYQAEKYYVRANFRIGIENGQLYGLFDNSDARDSEAYVGVSSAKVTSDVTLTADNWYHVAVSYDGKELAIVVTPRDAANRKGTRNVTASSLIPANGVFNVLREDGSDQYSTYSSAFVLGASADENGITPVTATYGASASCYSKNYVGYIGEVRVWDGARTWDEIADTCDQKLSYDDLIANRNEVYDSWSQGGTRSSTDGSEVLPAELVQQYTMEGLHGATETSFVATAPAAFTLNVTTPVNESLADIEADEPLTVGWYGDLDPSIRPTVYTDYAYVPWIKNAVSHLPIYDGSVADSQYWARNMAAGKPAVEAGVNKYSFPQTANPYTFAAEANSVGHHQQAYASMQAESNNTATATSLSSLYGFYRRSQMPAVKDLIPLGGVYAKRCSDFWDGQGAMDADTLTAYNGAADEAGNGLPDWWEEYCRDNYCGDDWDPSAVLKLDTMVSYYGVQMRAQEAYQRDLAKGMIPPNTYDTTYADVLDANENGIPDWWENIYTGGNYDMSDPEGDDDNDGLSNFTEYMLSEEFSLGVKFSPVKTFSISEEYPDYFHRVGSLYVGEIFADHDFIEDWWESEYDQDMTSVLVYDGKTDNDDDGWSTFAESRYSQEVSPIDLVTEHPIPTIQLTVKYNGSRVTAVEKSSIAVKVGRTASTEKSYDAEYYVAGSASESSSEDSSSSSSTSAASNNYTHVVGKWSNRHVLGTLTPGFIDASELSLECAYDPSAVQYSWTIHTSDTAMVSKRGTYAEYEQDVRSYGAGQVQLLESSSVYNKVQGLQVRANSTTATLSLNQIGTIGTVDLTTGEYDLDFTALEGKNLPTSTNRMEMASAEDLTYRFAYQASESTGLPRELYLAEADAGRVREGKNTIMVWADLDGDEVWSAGEPFGFVRDVDIGWRKNTVEVELTDFSAVTPRIDVWSAESDRGLTVADTQAVLSNQVMAADISAQMRSTLLGRLTWLTTHATLASELPSDDYTPARIRVVRWAVDGRPIYGEGITPRVVMDKDFYQAGRTFLNEGDFLTDGNYDIDWANLKTEIVQNETVELENLDVTNVMYLVVYGDGPISFNSSTDTNKVVAVVDAVISRTFDKVQAVPTLVAPGTEGSIVYAAKPTFKWTVPGTDMNRTSVSGYPAFELQVLDGSTVVWDSGIQLNPVRNSAGEYVYEAPCYVGNELAASKNYKWRVTALNAKFNTPKWSETATFRMEPETKGADLGSITVQAKYYGPDTVLENSKVVFEAFTSPDFTGDPAGRVVTTDISSQAVIEGVKTGAYYIRAYIDSTVYGTQMTHDDWESWGYSCDRSGSTAALYAPMAVAVDGECVIYIEDTDVNGNRLPDAWEMAYNKGTLSDGTTDIDSNLPICGFAVKSSLLQTNALSKNSVTAFYYDTLTTKGIAALAMGVEPEALSVNAAGQLQVVSEVESVEITSVSMTDGQVTITVDGALETPATAALYAAVAAPKTVTCEVYRKTTLAGANDWELVASKEITVGAGAQSIPLADMPAADSAFFKVVVK